MLDAPPPFMRVDAPYEVNDSTAPTQGQPLTILTRGHDQTRQPIKELGGDRTAGSPAYKFATY